MMHSPNYRSNYASVPCAGENNFCIVSHLRVHGGDMRGNKAGLAKAEALVDTWMKDNKTDPTTATVEYVYYGGGAPVFGISAVEWKEAAGYAKGETAWLSARFMGVRASACDIRGAIIRSKAEYDKVLGFLAFGNGRIGKRFWEGGGLTAKEFVIETVLNLWDGYTTYKDDNSKLVRVTKYGKDYEVLEAEDVNIEVLAT